MLNRNSVHGGRDSGSRLNIVFCAIALSVTIPSPQGYPLLTPVGATLTSIRTRGLVRDLVAHDGVAARIRPLPRGSTEASVYTTATYPKRQPSYQTTGTSLQSFS